MNRNPAHIDIQQIAFKTRGRIAAIDLLARGGRSFLALNDDATRITRSVSAFRELAPLVKARSVTPGLLIVDEGERVEFIELSKILE